MNEQDASDQDFDALGALLEEEILEPLAAILISNRSMIFDWQEILKYGRLGIEQLPEREFEDAQLTDANQLGWQMKAMDLARTRTEVEMGFPRLHGGFLVALSSIIESTMEGCIAAIALIQVNIGHGDAPKDKVDAERRLGVAEKECRRLVKKFSGREFRGAIKYDRALGCLGVPLQGLSGADRQKLHELQIMRNAIAHCGQKESDDSRGICSDIERDADGFLCIRGTNVDAFVSSFFALTEAVAQSVWAKRGSLGVKDG